MERYRMRSQFDSILRLYRNLRLWVVVLASVTVSMAQAANDVRGIDISRYQGVINWKQVKSHREHPVKFVYAKASQGVTIRDERYVPHLTGARKEGILVGSYHFLSAGGTGVEQCDYFMETISAVPQDLIPVVDIEVCPPGWGAMMLRRHLDDFLKRMEEKYAIRPMIYTGIFFYNTYLAGHYSGYPLFLARYGDEPPIPIDGREWLIWQFSEKGRVNGIQGNVDLDRMNSKNTLNDILWNSSFLHKAPAVYRGHPHRHPNKLPKDAGLNEHS